MLNEENKKPRNLRKQEAKLVVDAFIQILKNIKINGKPFVTASSKNFVTTNPNITIEEIQTTFNVPDETKMEFVRQLYIHSGTKILKKLFPDEEILNLPIVSFEENGATIH